jgi:hypothetical protein
MTDTEQAAPEELVEEALTSARRVIRYGRRAKKSLDAIRKQSADKANALTFAEARTEIAKIAGKSGSDELDACLSAWLEASSGLIDEALEQRHRQLLAGIQERAEAAEIPVRKLANTPPTIELGPFQLELEMGEPGQLKIGLEPVTEVEASVGSIFDAIEQTRAAWDARTPPPDALFERLHRAYRIACASRSTVAGERIPIVELLAPLALAECDAGSLRDQGVDAATAYPRHLLARQLALLSRSGHLEHAGYRLELGAATGGSTADKRDVLYVHSSSQRGQFYLSIRFVRI